jgi:hypothetical protein
VPGGKPLGAVWRVKITGGYKMRLVTSHDILGHMARWAVQQHPYHEPVGLFEVCKFIEDEAGKHFKDGVPSLPMWWCEDMWALNRWLHEMLDDHPTLTRWNTPRSGHTQQIVGSSRYDGPAPEDDFIDIDALLRNVARCVWDDAEEHERTAA